MKIKMLRDVRTILGALQIGQELEVETSLGLELIALGDAAQVSAPAEKKPAAARKPRAAANKRAAGPSEDK